MKLSELVRPILASQTLVYVSGIATLVGIYALLPIALEYSPYHDMLNTSSDFHAVLSLVLGWLLVFRTNTAYSRWWEARTLWGALVNASRNLAMKMTASGCMTEQERPHVNELIVAFPVALKCHLRNEVEMHLPDTIRSIVGSDTQHVPQALARKLYHVAWQAKQDGRIDSQELLVLDAELLRLMDICGGCERILKTRIVKSYRVFARQCVLLFLITLPWGLVHDFRIWTFPITIITAYFMLGLETVAEHVEEPFGYDEDDLDLEALCATIGSTVDETFRDKSILNGLAARG